MGYVYTRKLNFSVVVHCTNHLNLLFRFGVSVGCDPEEMDSWVLFVLRRTHKRRETLKSWDFDIISVEFSAGLRKHIASSLHMNMM